MRGTTLAVVVAWLLVASGPLVAGAEPVEPTGQAAAITPETGRSLDLVDLGREPAVAGERKWAGPPVDLSLRDADLAEVLRSLAKLGGFNLVLDPKVEGTVTLELHDVPLEQAFHVILKSHGLGVERSRGLARVRDQG